MVVRTDVEVRRLADGSSLVTLLGRQPRELRVAASPAEVWQVLPQILERRSLSDAADGALVTALTTALRPYPADAPADRNAEAAIPPLSSALLVGDLAPAAGALLDGLMSTQVVAGTSDLAAAEPAGHLLVSAYSGPATDRMLLLDAAAHQYSLPWLPLWIEGGVAFLGPFLVPGVSPGYRDALGRRVAGARDENLLRIRLRPPDHASVGLEPHRLMLALTVLTTEVALALAGRRPASWWREVEIDLDGPDGIAVTGHPVLPLPHRTVAGRPPFGAEGLVDGRTGVVLEVTRRPEQPGTPAGLVSVSSRIGDMSRLYPWAPNELNAGRTWHDPDLAGRIAVGEGIERYCANSVDPGRLRRASRAELVAEGLTTIDPLMLRFFSEEQYAAPGFPFLPFHDEHRLHWIEGRKLPDGDPVWVPASLVFINWNGDSVAEPALHPAFYPGVAAGPTLAEALLNGIEEVVERHAMTAWWLAAPQLPLLAPPPAARALLDSVDDAAVRGFLVHLDNEFDFPVVAAAVDDAARELFTLGFAARPTVEQACLKAMLEGFCLRLGALDLQDPDGEKWTLLRARIRGPRVRVLKPVRADRRYLDSYRSDFKDVTDLWCQLQVQLDPRAYARERPWDAGRTVHPADLPPSVPRGLDAYVERISSRGHDVIYVDVTTPDVAKVGFAAVRVLIPGLLPNFPAAFPPLGGGRLRATAERLGWIEPGGPLAVNTFPLPYS